MKKTSNPIRINTRQQLLAVAVATCFATGAQALPTDPTKVLNVGAITTVGQTMTVNSSGRAILNWNTFGIGAGETVRFQQDAASSRILNQVVGANGVTQMSQIYGTLSSNGQVWLVNPAGITVGAGGIVDTAGFVASTLKIRPEDFLAGQLNFQATTGAGNVINQGTIRTPSGGSVYLIGSNVSNEGIITTPQGETILAAGETVSLIDTATPGVKVEITGAANNATNLGTITAEAGRIGIAGSIVKNSGTLNASSVANEGGRIFLKASQDTYVDGNGRIVATGTKGGKVEVLGNRVAVMDNASIDASGTNGGGKILVGGDYQGKNASVQNAYVTFFGPNATLKANATKVGNGGTVIAWADDSTRAYGSIEAKGAGGGKGGFVETSGHRYLDINGVSVNTAGGMWLLDPANINIVDTYSPTTVYGSNPDFYFDPLTDTTIGWNQIASQITSGNLTLYGGNISFTQSAAQWTYNSGYWLKFNATGDINLSTIYGKSTTIINQYGGVGGNISFIADGGIHGDWWSGVYNTPPIGGLNLTTSGAVSFTSNYHATTVNGFAKDSAINLGNGYITSGFSGGTAISLSAPYGAIGVGHLRAIGSGGNIQISAGNSIWNNNWPNESDYNYYLTGGSLSLYSEYGAYAYSSCVDGCDAIHGVVAGTPGSINASVSSLAWSGGIGIDNVGSVPTSIVLGDYSQTNEYNYVEYYQLGDLNLNSASYQFLSYGGGVYIDATGNLTVNGAVLNSSQGQSEIGLYAGNTLTVGTNLITSGYAGMSYKPFIGLAAGSAVNVNATLTSGDSYYGGDIGMVAGVSAATLDEKFDQINSAFDFFSSFVGANGTLTINGNVTAGSDVGMVAGNITINSGKTIITQSYYDHGIMAYASNQLDMNGTLSSVASVALVAGSTLNMTGGHITAGDSVELLANDINLSNSSSVFGYYDVAAFAGNNITLTDSSIGAGYETYLGLMGATSTLAFYGGSMVSADVPYTIYLDFFGRSSGGITIEGVDATPADFGSIFHVAGQPAVLGSGLYITYATTQTDPCALSPEICNPPPQDKPIIVDPIIVGGCAGTQAGCAPPPAEDQGGGEGEFGEGENKGKGKKKAAQCKG